MTTSHARMEYNDFTRIAPAVSAALSEMGKAVSQSGLDKDLTELIKIRASQINGCAFCVQFHLNIARKLGVAASKLDMVAVWREAGIYTAREQAALKWTEVLTDVARRGSPDDVYGEVREQFSEVELAHLTAAIANINAWNRIAMGYRFSPQIPA
ncbi:carboxymuconolactone decarboxylase family protein [Noviherbaspirillum cavernae]|uniref:Carboxymuconolactone decarboxylase family protein n=1 Tax=Noviherbaspirillum cavernae TaxID=2320862 RepID=A0A418WZ44_9BURK|nr:carboxymuconolactone decarboxylase family protein [Noviherbaspirillum cavernae]RJG05508.1 carboxymuconolactone decarboxylase family protein [Noviherbaspirillum cavernae]